DKGLGAVSFLPPSPGAGAAGADNAGDVAVWLPRLAHLDVPEHVAGERQRRAGGVAVGEQFVDVGGRQLEPGVASVGPGGGELAPVVKAGNSAHRWPPEITRAEYCLILHNACNMSTWCATRSPTRRTPAAAAPRPRCWTPLAR